MTHGPLNDDAVESYRTAGAVLTEALTDARTMEQTHRSQRAPAQWRAQLLRHTDRG